MLPKSAVFPTRSGSSGVGIGGGGGGGGEMAQAGASASASLNVLGVRGAGAWRGGEGQEKGGSGGEAISTTDELIASFTFPPGDGGFLPSPFNPVLPPLARYVDPLLTAYLEVVDYVLRKPFSDETFRLLLEATEMDHRRVSA